MTIEYNWEFSNIKVKNTETQSNIVHSYSATITGILDEFFASETFDIVTSSEHKIENFTSFDHLSKDQFVEWTESSLGLLVEKAKNSIKYNLNRQVENSKYNLVNVPWEIT
jgi:hypothetical protein